MGFLDSIIFGIVEGITEFLPISSTGHLILTSKILNLPNTDFLKTFEISIQLGAILSVVVLYWKKFLVNLAILKRVALAFVPTGILGLLFYKIVKTYLMNSALVILISLFAGGVVLILFEVWYEKKNILSRQSLSASFQAGEDIRCISYKNSFLIGVFQSIAMIPGVSRSAATIIGGLLLGFSRQTIVEFSFLLAVPTMMAATGLDLFKNANSFSTDQFVILLVGFVISFFVALLTIKWLLKFIKNHSFISFGIYRIIISLIFFLIIF